MYAPTVAPRELFELLARGEAALRYTRIEPDGETRGVSPVVAKLRLAVVDETGDVHGECDISWVRLSHRTMAWLEVCADAWAAFGAVPGFWGVVSAIGGDPGPDRDEVCRALGTIGFTESKGVTG